MSYAEAVSKRWTNNRMMIDNDLILLKQYKLNTFLWTPFEFKPDVHSIIQHSWIKDPKSLHCIGILTLFQYK